MLPDALLPDLATIFADAFDNTQEMRRFLRLLPGGEALDLELPSTDTSRSRYAFAAMDGLQRRGGIDRAFFVRLQDRGLRTAEIAALWARTPEGSAVPLGPVPGVQPPLHVTCDRKKQLDVFLGQPRARRVIVRGFPGSGHAFFLRRCLAWPHQFDADEVIAVPFPDQLAPLDVLEGWAVLTEALEADPNPRNPRGPAIDTLVLLAEGHRSVLLLHGTVRAAEGNLDVLARYHQELTDRIADRTLEDGTPLTERVRVIQSVEEIAGGGDELAKAGALFTDPATLLLPRLDDLPVDEIGSFAQTLQGAARVSDPEAFVRDVGASGLLVSARYRKMAKLLAEDFTFGEIS